MKKYNLVNDILGWVCFAVAAATYLLTLEPTASFWDCPEFISQGAKLEVGHPPGNPIFMLAARFFVTIFGNDISNAAIAVNTMSALLSAGTILLLFWTITHFARKLLVRDDATEVSPLRMALIMGAGLCGALAYTWSDTFWFSAVEGEVYAFSSFCTALVVWLMLKWENRAGLPHADRYLVLIAYVIGVSIAVHLLNLLCIPALGLIFYYRKWARPTAKGSIVALAVSSVIVGAILYGLVPGFVKVAQWFELLCVNSFGMSYNSGVLVYAILLVGVFIWAIRALDVQRSSAAIKWSFFLSMVLSGILFIGHGAWIGSILTVALGAYLIFFCSKVPVRIFNLIALSVFVIFIGYSSYALLLVRASANTPMNQNAPDNVFALASYLNREQYGERPLFKGTAFAEEVVMQEYPEGSGMYYVMVDEYGRPRTTPVDGYLRNERGGVNSTPVKQVTKVVKTSPSDPDRYVEEVERPDYETNPEMDMFFTRIYSIDPQSGYAHVNGYKGWAGYTTPDINEIPAAMRNRWAEQGYAPLNEVMPYLSHMETIVTARDDMGNPVEEKAVWKPGFGVNLRYFINYQLNHMYWRYFMWNFAGRQNDIQGNGEPHLGNWISGIPFIDNLRLGDQSELPDEFGKGNKGHNVFFMLPLILGLIGLLWQALSLHKSCGNSHRGIEQFWVVFFLFFMTGIAIVLYLNQTPGQPRERDYAFAGSFYAFAIWIGLGVPAVAMLLRQLFTPKAKGGAPASDAEPSKGVKTATAVFAIALGLFVPLQMVSQTWDDHDRSGRYTARDFGMNYLSSVDPDGIIFTNGDNDTFPLWYAQEVEGFRTDVRVVNLSYLTTDWYANQLAIPSYEAQPVPMTATPRDYAYERLGWSFVIPRNSQPAPADSALRALYTSDAKRYGAPYLESARLFIPVDTAAAMKRYTMGSAALDSTYLAPYLRPIAVDLSSSTGLNQSKTLSLDIIDTAVRNAWKRPVYFATTVPSSYYMGMNPHLSSTGLAYEVTPFANAELDPTADKAFVNIVSTFRWGGLDAPDSDKLYLDETVRRMVSSMRTALFSTAESLIAGGDEVPASPAAKAAAVKAGFDEPRTQRDMGRILISLMEEKLPARAMAYDGLSALFMAQTYLDLYLADGRTADLERAKELLDTENVRNAQLVKYATTLTPRELSTIGHTERNALQYLSASVGLRNVAELLGKLPADDVEARAFLHSLSVNDMLSIAPVIYASALTTDELAAHMDELRGSERLIGQCISLLELHKQLGVEPMGISNEVLAARRLTPAQWLAVIN